MHPVALAFFVLLAACGGSGSTADPAGAIEPGGASDAAVSARVDAGTVVTFSELYAELFPASTAARCNFCHSMPESDTSNGKLSVGSTQASAYAALLDQTSSSSQCGGMPLVVPGDPDASLFLLKLDETPPCGSRMPLGGAQLSAAQRERVRRWIAAGAKND